MTSDYRLNNILKDVPNYGGVYLYDEINKIDQLNDKVIVINYVTRQEAEEGKVGHFVSLDTRKILKNNNYLGPYFFDPYGLMPDEPRNIMQLPNTENITNLIKRLNINDKIHYNNKDFQVLQPHDDLCGIYNIFYVKNPNFNSNQVFYSNENRHIIDAKLTSIFSRLGLLEVV